MKLIRQNAAEFAKHAESDDISIAKNQHNGWTTLSFDIVFGLA